MDIASVLSKYDTSKFTVATLGSHSALDICSGAKRRGFATLVVAEKGREDTYARHYQTSEDRGCVDETLVLSQFKDVADEDIQRALRSKNVIFVPHRSFEVYLDFNYDLIENRFHVPLFGSRHMLKIEERDARPNQYDLLKEAQIRIPRIFENPSDIDRPVIVKVLEKERGFERAFFIAGSKDEYEKKAAEFVKKGVIAEDALEGAVIEEFVMGVQVNLNYFYSPVHSRLEFLGPDTRRQTNIEGLLRLPAKFQEEAMSGVELKFEEAGHIAVTLLESMLEQVFALGERFVSAAEKAYSPGIIGPFALQAFVVPGAPKKEFVVFDVSPRVPGSPGIRFSPYGEYLWGAPMSTGERIGAELQDAITDGKLLDVIT